MNYFMYTSHHYQYLIFQLTSVLNSKPVADSNCFSFPFRVRVIGFLLYLLTNLHKQADFWQVNIFHLFLSRYSNQSHNFITLIFVRSSLSSLLLFRVDGQKQSEAAMFGRSVFFGLKTEEKNLRFQTKTDTCVVKGQVIRATFSHNLSRNIVALQVEKRCWPYYHPRSQLVTQQISMLQVAAL